MKFMTMKDEMTEMGRVKPGDHRGTPGIEKTEDDENGQDTAEDHGLLTSWTESRIIDRTRPGPFQSVVPAASSGCKRLDLLLDPVHDLHGIGPGLFQDVQGDGGDPVDQGQGSLLLDAVP